MGKQLRIALLGIGVVVAACSPATAENVDLSEAGSGKTYEIRNIACTLRGQGKPAFFLRLEHIPRDFEDAFEVGTYEAFEKWLSSGEEGWLLLDSVDEARL